MNLKKLNWWKVSAVWYLLVVLFETWNVASYVQILVSESRNGNVFHGFDTITWFYLIFSIVPLFLALLVPLLLSRLYFKNSKLAIPITLVLLVIVGLMALGSILPSLMLGGFMGALFIFSLSGGFFAVCLFLFIKVKKQNQV